MPPSDTVILVQSTLKLYRDAITEAAAGVLLNWRLLGLHFCYLLLFAVLAPIAGMFGGLAGGFLVGMVLALVLGNYLATVSAAVQKERLQYREAFERGMELFSPLISVLFALFLLNLLLGFVLKGPESMWIRASINLFITVLFNPIPEVIYHRGGLMGELFAESLEFVKENFIEWFLPALLFVLPLLLLSSEAVLPTVLFVLTTNPLYLIERLLMHFSSPGLLLLEAPLVALVLAILYFLMTVRGVLYGKLATSSRRKRIYQARQG
ncbi:MAG: hypothetical protein KDD69_17450 [Bdellovibrionales bacterium]|nr:hypothetical protein [Bdellovibrionales bacterium]